MGGGEVLLNEIYGPFIYLVSKEIALEVGHRTHAESTDYPQILPYVDTFTHSADGG